MQKSIAGVALWGQPRVASVHAKEVQYGTQPYAIGARNGFSVVPRKVPRPALRSTALSRRPSGLEPSSCLQWLFETMLQWADPSDPAVLDRLLHWADTVPWNLKFGQSLGQ